MSNSATHRRLAAPLLLFALIGASAIAPASAQEPGKATSDDPSIAFFKKGEIPKLRIELDPKSLEKLHSDPREWTPCRIRENDKTVYDGVSIKLKGAAGSFREFDDKPALTLRMDKIAEEQRFHGLAKFHLNNSVQDESYLDELLASDLFRAAGQLAPRITHAHVWLNERDVGLYVLKEGFDKVLLHRGFEKASGNLYDGGFCQDIDAELERDSGKGKDDRADLQALLAACNEPDVVKRWPLIAERLDVDRFITFMAMEAMLGHWDGYCQNRNNYRLYFDPTTGKACFLPHGMDQLFQDPDASVLDHPPAIVAAAVMKNPEWRAAYRRRIGELLPLFDAGKLAKRVDEVAKRLAPVLRTIEHERARNHEGLVADLKTRLEAREKSLKAQKAQPEPKPLVFAPDTPVKLDRWRNMSECEDAELSEEKVGVERVYRIACGTSKVCVASWRKSVLLPRGHYRFQAAFSARDVTVLAEDGAPGVGGGLRIMGSTRENKVVGNSGPKTIEFDFAVEEEVGDVELIFELRASRGQIQVRGDSLKLTRLAD
ncbi:MAG: hypothetical protein EXR75_14135 [Myxococcales bacterium]|nr:hypothetical protein [Myxococcales bacterium]